MNKLEKIALEINNYFRGMFKSNRITITVRKGTNKELNEFGGGRVYLGRNKKRINIEVFTNSYQHIKGKREHYFDQDEYRFGRYLRNNGLFPDIYNIFIMTILHEIGHIHVVHYFYSRDMAKEYDLIRQISISSISLIDEDVRNQLFEEGFNIGNLFNFDELLCDNFALTYFIPIHNLLKQKGLI